MKLLLEMENVMMEKPPDITTRATDCATGDNCGDDVEGWQF